MSGSTKKAMNRLPLVPWRCICLRLQHATAPLTRWLSPYTYEDWGRRIAHSALLVILLAGVLLPVLQNGNLEGRYVLAASEERIVGKSNANLYSKLTFDAQKQQYVFNAKDIQQDAAGGNPIAQLKQQVGNGSSKSEPTYSVELPVDLSKGITYYDNSMNVSFRLIAKFNAGTGREEDHRIVYPLSGGGKLVYSFKGNGMKEDVVLKTVPEGGSYALKYSLDVPNSLQARLTDSDGQLGIYSADPRLYGNISFGSSNDQNLVTKAREKGSKTHLVFVIPAPVLNDGKSSKGLANARVHYLLSGSELTVQADHLSKLSYPLSIDPSVVVTSTADFTSGNNEGDITYATAGQVTRGSVTGGSAGAWTGYNVNASCLSGANCNGRVDAPAAVSNGYVYMAGGYGWNFAGTTCCGYQSDVIYAAINSNGSLGAWAQSGTTLPYGNNVVGNGTSRADLSIQAYNGNLYIMGGWNGTTYYNDVWYVPLNANGSLNGSFVQANSFTTGRIFSAVTIYKDYLYIFGGYNGTTYFADAQYVNIKSDGSLGAWATTNAYTTGRYDFSAVAYSNYMYIFGGYDGTTVHNDVQYTAIKSDGTLGTWMTTTSFSNARESHGVTFWNGYFYLMGGQNGATKYSDTQYSPVNANGTLGVWITNPQNFTDTHGNCGTFAYNGYIYQIAGYDWVAANYRGDVQYSAIDGAGATEGIATSGNTYDATARVGVQEVAYNGYLYVMGGYNGITAPVKTVDFASFNPDGTINAFSTTTALSTARTWFGAFAYNGIMYVIGGCSSKNSSCTTAANDLATVHHSSINATTGALGAWTTTDTSLGTAIYGLTIAAYNGYMYVFGGINASTFQTAIYYQAFTAAGALSGTWSTSGKTIPAALGNAYLASAIYSGYVYLAGGCTVGALTCTTVKNAVYYATVGGGDIGALNVGSSFATARGQLGLAAANGYLYLAGGWNGTTYYSDEQYVPLNPNNGSMGTWTTATNTSLANVRRGIGMASYQGFLYVAGGYDGTTYYNNVMYTAINNGGTGASGSWTTGTSYASFTVRHSVVSVVSSGYLYVMGGVNGASTYTDIFYVNLNSDGSLGTWSTSGTVLPFAPARSGFAAVAYSGYLYVIGGYDGTTYQNDVYYTGLSASGGLTGAFTHSANTFTNGRYYLGAAAYNGYLYVAGGQNASTYYADVQYSPITAGAIGAWTVSGNTFNSGTGRSHPGVTIYNGYLYVAGGVNGTTYYNDVWFTAISAVNGSIGTFASTTPFNIGRMASGLIAYNGFIYSIGGYGGTSYYADIQFAPISNNGTLGSWNTSVATTGMTTREQFGSALYNGFLYVAGGNNASDLNSTQYSPLNTVPRLGLYSKFVDFGTVGQISSVSINGAGTYTINYTLAFPGAAFSSWANASIPSPFTTSNADAGRYMWNLITVDDSYIATYPDINGSVSNVTDFTINFSTGPSPGSRLRHGASFVSGQLQPLNTFGP